MNKETSSTTTKPPISLERTFRAPIEKVWRMWTTKDGLEKWWGPEGFATEVRRLDVRVGGGFEIVMTAVLQAIIDHLKASGVNARNVSKGDYTEVATNERLAYTNAVDFVPGVAPYETATTVELSPVPGGGTRQVVVTGAMHDDRWTKMATMGWESQLAKLTGALAEIA
jgi:uncharacterized protein YndB with AHSA1/START domain